MFVSIADKARKDLRELMSIPKEFTVFFLTGGASLVFSSIPYNFLKGKNTANYLTTGYWTQTAKKEAEKYCKVNEVWADSEKAVFTTIPDA